MSTDIQRARDVLKKWRDGSTPGPWTFTVGTYGSDFGDYRAAEIPDVAMAVWTENDGPVAPLTPEDAALIVGTVGNPELLDALYSMLGAAESSPGDVGAAFTIYAQRIAAAIIAADERINA